MGRQGLSMDDDGIRRRQADGEDQQGRRFADEQEEATMIVESVTEMTAGRSDGGWYLSLQLLREPVALRCLIKLPVPRLAWKQPSCRIGAGRVSA